MVADAVDLAMLPPESADSVESKDGSQDGSQEEEVKSRLSSEPEMCQEDRDFFEWEEICECQRPITMDECDCQAYKAYREREQKCDL
jgi:hypothetical protein